VRSCVAILWFKRDVVLERGRSGGWLEVFLRHLDIL
jgi:hypothetical protein